MGNEANLQKYLLHQAKAQDIFARKLVSPGRRGFPDVMLGYQGQVVFIELKSPTGRGILSELQALEINRMERVGLTVTIIASKEEADAIIRKITNTRSTKRDRSHL